MVRVGDVCERKADTIKATYKGNIDYGVLRERNAQNEHKNSVYCNAIHADLILGKCSSPMRSFI